MTNFAHRDTIEIESARYQIYDTKTQKTNLDISVHIWYYYLLVLHRMHHRWLSYTLHLIVFAINWIDTNYFYMEIYRYYLRNTLKGSELTIQWPLCVSNYFALRIEMITSRISEALKCWNNIRKSVIYMPSLNFAVLFYDCSVKPVNEMLRDRFQKLQLIMDTEFIFYNL